MPEPVTVAVDANGADRGPAEVARGAAVVAAAGTRVLLFGPAAELGEPVAGVEILDTPVSIAKDSDPARAVRRTPEASIVRAASPRSSGAIAAMRPPSSATSAVRAAVPVPSMTDPPRMRSDHARAQLSVISTVFILSPCLMRSTCSIPLVTLPNTV